MLPLKVTLTPTMITFENLPDEVAEKIKEGDVKHNLRNGYYIQADPKTLYKILLDLSYNYDIEIV